MPYGYDVKEQALQTEAATIAANTTETNLNAVAEGVEVFFAAKANLHVEFVRAVSGTSPVTLYFGAIGAPGQAFPNVPSFSVTIELNDPVLLALGDPTNIVADATVDTDCYYAIKLLAIKNADAVNGVTGLVVRAAYKL
jgi:hypothetical protein